MGVGAEAGAAAGGLGRCTGAPCAALAAGVTEAALCCGVDGASGLLAATGAMDAEGVVRGARWACGVLAWAAAFPAS